VRTCFIVDADPLAVFVREHHAVSRMLLPSFGTKPLTLTVSEVFNGECDAMVDVTLNDL